jgi:hypothetical protein
MNCGSGAFVFHARRQSFQSGRYGKAKWARDISFSNHSHKINVSDSDVSPQKGKEKQAF